MTTKEENEKIGEDLVTLFLIGTWEEIERKVKEIAEAGLEWAAVFSDGLVSNNARWIFNSRSRGCPLDGVLVGNNIWE